MKLEQCCTNHIEIAFCFMMQYDELCSDTIPMMEQTIAFSNGEIKVNVHKNG